MYVGSTPTCKSMEIRKLKKLPEFYRLFLDDIRLPEDIFRLSGMEIFADPNWTIATSYESFVDTISFNWEAENRLPTIISFDHDLGIIELTDDQSKVLSVVTSTGNYEKSGLDCAKWLIEYFTLHQLKLPSILVHSQNPVGRQNIINLFNDRKRV